MLVSKLGILALLVLSLQFSIYHLLDGPDAVLVERRYAENSGFTLSLSDLRVDYEDGLDVLYFGDSTALHISGSPGTISNRTGKLLASKLPNHEVQAASSAGLRFDVYDLMYRYSMNTTDRIEVLVAPVNVRSFSPPWLHNPALQFRRFKTALILGRYDLDALLRPVLSFNAMKSVAPSRAMLGERVKVAIGRHSISNPSRWRELMHYDFAITPDHLLFRSIRSMGEATRRSGTTLVLYATPIDFSYIETEYGRKIELLARKNLSTVMAFCEGLGISVLDFSDALPRKYLMRIGPTASHLTGEGRDELARLLAESLQQNWLVD